MKKLFTLLSATILCTATACAQHVNLIKQADVQRIIATLAADDMQGRATFTPGIEKAAQFIESEFKQIGLKPMTGDAGFRQNFSMTHIVPLKAQVNINGEGIPSNHIIILGGTAFNWSNNADVEIVQEVPGKNFRADYKKIISSGKKTLVLMDPAFEALFKMLYAQMAAGTTTNKPNTAQQVVFVLGKFENIKSFEVGYEPSVQQMPLFNVAGIIPGKTKPDEYVVFSAHYDHLGTGKGMQGDSIYNGADDDASGTTAVISLARYFKKLNNNARTLIFVAFTAEEIGEYGSQHFAKTVNPDKVVAMFNIEMIGKPSKWGENSAFITGFDRSSFGKILQQNLKGTNFKFYPDPYPDQNLFYRSDNASLARVGVPAHTISTDQIDVDKDYHQVTDELKTLDVGNITSAISAIALSARSIVAGTATPTRVPKLER